MFKRILFVVEPHPHAAAMIRTGASLAMSWNAEIVFYGGQPRRLPAVGGAEGEMAARRDTLEVGPEQVEQLVLQAVALAEGMGVMSRSMVSSGAESAPGIVSAAQTGRCDLIMVASEGHNAVTRLLTGNVIPGLVTSSPFPVLVCAPPPSPNDDAAGAGRHRILVVLDDCGQTQAVQTLSLGLAQGHAAGLLFVHILPSVLMPVVDGFGIAGAPSLELEAEFGLRSQRLLDRACTAARKAGLVARGVSMPAGTSAKDVAGLAIDEACDLIAVSHAGGNAVMRLLTGSLIPGLITAASVPLLICREGAEPPLRPAPRRRRHRRKATALTRMVPGPSI